MDNNTSNTSEHEREWYSSSIMSGAFLSSSENSKLSLWQECIRFLKGKIICSFREGSNIYSKCLMQIIFFIDIMMEEFYWCNQ